MLVLDAIEGYLVIQVEICLTPQSVDEARSPQRYIIVGKPLFIGEREVPIERLQAALDNRQFTSDAVHVGTHGDTQPAVVQGCLEPGLGECPKCAHLHGLYQVNGVELLQRIVDDPRPVR